MDREQLYGITILNSRIFALTEKGLFQKAIAPTAEQEYFMLLKANVRRMILKHKYEIIEISKKGANDFLQKHHYLAQQGAGFLGRIIYGLYNEKGFLVGVCVFGNVSAIETLIGAFEGFDRGSSQDGFWELTRLAMDDTKKEKNLTSWFVAKCLRRIKNSYNCRAIISYADSDYHLGYIYQATNFKYYGMTDAKKDFYIRVQGEWKKQTRGKTNGLDGIWLKRSRKHRYMIVYDKSLSVKWEEYKYPKGQNKEYQLNTEDAQISIFDYCEGW